MEFGLVILKNWKISREIILTRGDGTPIPGVAFQGRKSSRLGGVAGPPGGLADRGRWPSLE